MVSFAFVHSSCGARREMTTCNSCLGSSACDLGRVQICARDAGFPRSKSLPGHACGEAGGRLLEEASQGTSTNFPAVQISRHDIGEAMGGGLLGSSKRVGLLPPWSARYGTARAITNPVGKAVYGGM